MVVISCVLFFYGAKVVGWPSERGVRGSLVQPLAPGAFATGLVLLAVCAGIGTLGLSRRFFIAGLMTATAGLTVWASRGGTMVYVLFNANDAGIDNRIFLYMLGELIVFSAALVGGDVELPLAAPAGIPP